jgi:CHAD domain-containing protein
MTPFGDTPAPLTPDDHEGFARHRRVMWGTAMLAILGGTLEHLRANEQPVAAGHPEGVHQARVAIRRLRAGLWAFRGQLPAEERKAFNQEFRWFQGQLSPPRDWHVFLDETVPAIRSAFPGRSATAARLRQAALEQRTRVTEEVSGLFEGVRYTRLILRFTRWMAEQQAIMARSAGRQPIKDFAAAILDASHRKFVADSRPLSRMSAKKRHSLRKRGKKFRYACEFFAALWPGRRTDSYLRAMKKLQESLGVINDVSVAGEADGILGPGGVETGHGGLVQDWSAMRLEQCLRQTQPGWRKFQRRAPFWRPASDA